MTEMVGLLVNPWGLKEIAHLKKIESLNCIMSKFTVV